MTGPLPSVEVIIPTHNRPALLRLALKSVLAQSYGGRLGVAIVFDREEPALELSAAGEIPIRVLRNDRTSGLTGARNCGIVTSGAELVAFLDDDDQWLPEKLERQVSNLVTHPSAVLATTGIRIEFEGHATNRLVGRATVTHDDLLGSRMAMLHSSTFLLRREALLGPLGLVDESAPSSQNEDWDVLLRASAIAPVAHLDVPLVSVRWGSSSMFSAAWRSRIEGGEWILDRHPDIRTNRTGYARLLGQIAFGRACLGERPSAVRAAARCLRVRWREPRGYLALGVAAGVLSGAFVQRQLHRYGHGV